MCTNIVQSLGYLPGPTPSYWKEPLHYTNWSDTVEKQRKVDITTTTAPTTGPLQHHTVPGIPSRTTCPYLGKALYQYSAAGRGTKQSYSTWQWKKNKVPVRASDSTFPHQCQSITNNQKGMPW